MSDARTLSDSVSVVHEIDSATGVIQHTFLASSGGLRQAIGCPPHAIISGGTPALRLNRSHFLAIGHTMSEPCRLLLPAKAEVERCERVNKWRAYALFAYLFAASPPFRLAAASAEFRIGRRHGLLPAARTVATPWATPPEISKGEEGQVQFPMGLALDPRAPSERLLLSWGVANTHTQLTRLSLPHLLSRMRPLL